MAANDERKASVMSDKNGNVYKMRDYELLEQSETQTIGNTDYFVLEDVNGGYHKILKSSVMGIVREALGELVNSRDKATGAKSALVLDNNNDLGISSISAFAQMLGVADNKGMHIITRSFFTAGQTRTFEIGIPSIVSIIENQESGCPSLYVLGFSELFHIQGSKDYSSMITVGCGTVYTLSITPTTNCGLTIYALSMGL